MCDKPGSYLFKLLSNQLIILLSQYTYKYDYFSVQMSGLKIGQILCVDIPHPVTFSMD